MKKTILLLLLILSATFCQLTFAQSEKAAKPSESIALSEVEQKQAATAFQQFIDTRSAYQKAVAEAQSVELSDCGKVTAAIAKIQIAGERLANAQGALSNLEQTLAEVHKCKSCQLSNDLKTLVILAAKN
jgi:hypothetical protein